MYTAVVKQSLLFFLFITTPYGEVFTYVSKLYSGRDAG